MFIREFSFKNFIDIYKSGLRDLAILDSPSAIIMRFKAIPLVTVMLLSPRGYIWSVFPAVTCCDLGLISDDEAYSLWQSELLKSEITSPVPAGLVSLADNLDLSLEEDGAWSGPWHCAFDIKPGDEDRFIDYLDRWWQQLGFDALKRADDDTIYDISWLHRRNDLINKALRCDVDDIPLYDPVASLLRRAWVVFDNYPWKFSHLMKQHFHDFIELGDRISLNRDIEMLAGYHIGSVSRDTVVSACIPNKRLAPRAVYLDMEDELSRRDELFGLQCRLVNVLDNLSLFRSCGEAIKKYQESIAKQPIRGKPEYDALAELKDYQDRMLSRYPILAHEFDSSPS